MIDELKEVQSIIKKTKDDIKEQKQYIKNIKKSLENRDKTHDCEQILGSRKAVNEMANIWMTHYEKFKLLEYVTLKDFCVNNTFDSKEFEHYRDGLKYFNQFMTQCVEEVEKYIEEKKLTNDE